MADVKDVANYLIYSYELKTGTSLKITNWNYKS